jgi:hypothetical protein
VEGLKWKKALSNTFQNLEFLETLKFLDFFLHFSKVFTFFRAVILYFTPFLISNAHFEWAFEMRKGVRHYLAKLDNSI